MKKIIKTIRKAIGKVARKATLKITLNLTVKDIKQAYQRNFVTFSDMPVFISHQYSCFI